MNSLLSQAYGSMRLNEMCRLCIGNSRRWLDKHRCPLCRKTHQDYKDANLEREIEEMTFLRQTWIKCREFVQVTTGVKRLDLVITVLWGPPHNRNWRDYSKAHKPVVMDDHIILRLVRV